MTRVTCAFSYCKNKEICLKFHVDVFGPASERSNRIVVVGNNWLFSWLVGNAVFSETALRIFLIFHMTLGTIKVEKSQNPIFEKNS